MRSRLTVAAIGTLGLLASANSLSAQWVWLGGGATFPISDYGDYADTGYLLSGGLGYPLGDSGLNAYGEGFYGQNSHSDIDGDKTSPYGVIGGLSYDFAGPDADSGLEVFGGLGVLWHKFSSDTSEESTDSGLGLEAGAGYYFPLGTITGWVDGRITHASIEDENTTFIGVLAGISIPLGD